MLWCRMRIAFLFLAGVAVGCGSTAQQHPAQHGIEAVAADVSQTHYEALAPFFEIPENAPTTPEEVVILREAMRSLVQ